MSEELDELIIFLNQEDEKTEQQDILQIPHYPGLSDSMFLNFFVRNICLILDIKDIDDLNHHRHLKKLKIINFSILKQVLTYKGKKLLNNLD